MSTRRLILFIILEHLDIVLWKVSKLSQLANLDELKASSVTVQL